jgi:S-formylglutathione hydrolase FrmB
MMRLLLLLVMGWLTHAVAAERITFGEVLSAALGRTLPVAVIAPATLPAMGKAPVLYFLHGRGRHHRSLIESEAARTALLAAPCFIVLPQGEDGWYINVPGDLQSRYETYLEEVIAWAEREHPIATEPAARGIAGWSMGGYGAVRFAETHPGKFGFVASVIGLLDFPREENLPPGQNYKVPVARFTADQARWATLNPLNAVGDLSGAEITLVLATKGFELTMNENFLAALKAREMTARVHQLEGGHEFPLVERAVPLVVSDMAAFLAERGSVVSTSFHDSPQLP